MGQMRQENIAYLPFTKGQFDQRIMKEICIYTHSQTYIHVVTSLIIYYYICAIYIFSIAVKKNHDQGNL